MTRSRTRRSPASLADAAAPRTDIVSTILKVVDERWGCVVKGREGKERKGKKRIEKITTETVCATTRQRLILFHFLSHFVQIFEISLAFS